MPSHRHATRCASCHEPGSVTRPSGAWKILLVAGYALFSLMVFCASLLGPTIIAVLPLLAATGLGLLPWLHDRAGAPAACQACGRIAADEPAPSTAATTSTRVAHAA